MSFVLHPSFDEVMAQLGTIFHHLFVLRSQVIVVDGIVSLLDILIPLLPRVPAGVAAELTLVRNTLMLLSQILSDQIRSLLPQGGQGDPL
jgi:hypothetical protein